MFTPQSRLRLNEQEVAAKVIDGEAIIINLANGIYYSMDKVGALIWELLAAGHSLAEVTTAVLARYDITRERAETDVQKLVVELVQENLLVTSQDAPAFLNGSTGEPPQKLPYEAPQLNTYRDMGDLLALDPPTPGLQDMVWKEPDDESPQ